VDFGAYDLIVCNFPSIISSWRARGWRADYFFPAHDPVMDEYASTEQRLIDVCFVGTFSRHHVTRAHVLEAVAKLSNCYDVRFYLDQSRLTRLAEHPFIKLLPTGRFRVPPDIKNIAKTPVFGRDLYAVLGSSKIVLNGAIDIAGNDRGNMRCFEAMGCGAVMVSDDGVYPEGMTAGFNLFTYRDPAEAVARIRQILNDWPRYQTIGKVANAAIRERYSKERQWDRFLELVGSI
jgi:glycosyltransferase involved in cell wall biosynthesis